MSTQTTPGSRGRAGIFLFVLCLTTLMSTIDTNIVNIGLPAIARAMHTGFSSVQWIALGYLLALTSVIVGIGRLGDLFGKKRLFLAGIVLFTGSSFLCGLSASVGVLIAMRMVQGFGGAFMVALAFALAADLLPHDRLVRDMGILTAMMPIGIALGPPVGGILISFLGWPSIFFLNVPLGIAALLLALRFPAPPAPDRGGRFDFPGVLVLAGILICYSLAVTFAENDGMSVRVVLLLGAAAAGVAFFLWLEHRSRSPLVPLGMFRNRVFSGSLGMGVILYTVITGANMIMPFYLQQAKGYDSALSGLLMVFGPLGCSVFSAVAGPVAERFGNRRVMLGGVAGFTVGVFAMCMLWVDSSPVLFAVLYFSYSACFAFFQTPNNAAIVSGARPEQRGLSSALLNLSRSVGQTTGTALLGAIFASFAAMAAGSGHHAVLPRTAVAAGIRSALFAAGCFCAVAFVVGFFTLKDTASPGRPGRPVSPASGETGQHS